MFFHQCFLITLCTLHSRRSPWLQLPRWLSRSDVVVPSRPLPVDGRPHSRLLNSPHLIYVTFMSASILCHGCYLVHFCNMVILKRETPLSFEGNFRLYFLTHCNVSLFSSSETLLETLDMIDYHNMHYFVAMPRICHMTKTLYR